jgi:hypothetical protein
MFIGLSGAEKDTFMVLQGSVWQTNNDGQTWSNVTNNMTSTNVYGNNTIASNGEELFVGTYGGGVFKSSGLNISSSITEHNFSQTISAFPNPSSHIITFHIKNTANTNFTIYDLLGNIVSNYTKTVNQSENELTIDISNLTNGTYTITMNSILEKPTSIQFIKID